MNYQSVRTAIETPFQTNYGALSPAIPIFFDNFYNVLADSVDEFINVNGKKGFKEALAKTIQWFSNKEKLKLYKSKIYND